MFNETPNVENEITVSFDGVKIKEFRAYWKAVSTGDWGKQDAFFAKVVKSWPFEGDPKDANNYEDLTLNQFIAVQNAIRRLSVQTGMSLWSEFQSYYNKRE